MNQQVVTSKTQFLNYDAELLDNKHGVKSLVRFNNGLTSMSVSVIRNADGDFSKNGVTSRESRLTLLMDPDKYEGMDPETTLVVRATLFEGQCYFAAVPISLVFSGVHSMAGGNYVNSLDSRFPFVSPIHVHDRVE